MEITDWHDVILPQSLLDSEEFKSAVRTALRTEWPPPEGLVQDLPRWLENYDIYHKHLIPIEAFEIPIDEAIELHGLPYYTPVENPTNFTGIVHDNLVRDTAFRSELIRAAKDKYDARWYMIVHACWFNVITTGVIATHMWPERHWQVLESNNHAVITNGSLEEFEDYLTERLDAPSFYIIDAVIRGKNRFADLMLRSVKQWKLYELADYTLKCKREFFFEDQFLNENV